MAALDDDAGTSIVVAAKPAKLAKPTRSKRAKPPPLVVEVGPVKTRRRRRKLTAREKLSELGSELLALADAIEEACVLARHVRARLRSIVE